MQNQQPTPQKYGNALQRYGNNPFNPSRNDHARGNNNGMSSNGFPPMDYNPPNLGRLSNAPPSGFPPMDYNPPNFDVGSGMPPGGLPPPGGPSGEMPMKFPPGFNPTGPGGMPMAPRSQTPAALGLPTTGQNPMNFSGPGQSISPNAPYNLQPPLPAPQTSKYNTGLVSPQSGVQSSIINGSSTPAKTNFAQNAMTAMKKNPFSVMGM